MLILGFISVLLILIKNMDLVYLHLYKETFTYALNQDSA
jgi:hypothetical protein